MTRGTALDRYDRLEATGTWRAGPDAAAREVVVTFGEARLTLLSFEEEALAQWSLAALVQREGDAPNIRLITPDAEFGEVLTLETGPLTEALDLICPPRGAAGPRARRARATVYVSLAVGIIAALVTLGTQPKALVTAVPEPSWQALSTRIETALGERCAGPAHPSLGALAARARIAQPPAVYRGEATRALRLPDGRLLLSSALVLHPFGPEVPAAALIEAETRAEPRNARVATLGAMALGARLAFTFTGALPDRPEVFVAPAHGPRFAARMATLGLPTEPYAEFLLDSGGDDRRAARVAAADSIGTARFTSALPDSDWLRLQSACGA